ncbi:MAG: hypothetical protein M2R45_02625 [Verrucomicrobia subdivision 3 bacterium]|nr:hypothetical protein [Limisphaerales bacterium]MCS1416407.1 hypothetical protein [Limisphaerales bacterium]
MFRLPAHLAESPGGPEAFLPGDLIFHKRYHYRGVIVSVDPKCLADDAWYHSNQTQPKINQPWYHVLVHNSTQITYTAHSSIEPDKLKSRINHPMIAIYFERFDAGHYIRNDKPWPG